MRITPEKISQIQTVLIKDDESVDFAVVNQPFGNGHWYVSNNDVLLFGKEDQKEGAEIEHRYSERYDDRPLSEFFNAINNVELKARIFVGRRCGKEEYIEYTDWNKLAKALGVSDLVTVATKIPKVVAKRFELFANQRADRSSVLRKLVYDYVKKQMIDQAEDLMFKENI